MHKCAICSSTATTTVTTIVTTNAVGSVAALGRLSGRCSILPPGTILLYPLLHLTVLIRHGLDDEIVASFQRFVRMIRTVAVRMRKSHLALGDGADEGPFAGVKALVSLQLAALGEGTIATGIVALGTNFEDR
uniref:Uncharacterized protein n=1 Tax=Anopheles farauti TaxID=69004 RepID=A0A182QCZ7_9DIPT